jgi:L-ascorbate metabolism protein UlaG (beta-lactamase superfamily)
MTRLRWFGQSAFLLTGERTVLIDPFGDMRATAAARAIRFDYPPVRDVAADLVLVTHEHFDHNGVDGVMGSPVVVRSTAGKFDSPVGEIVAIASEHDDVAGTMRGPNTIFVFSLDGLRFCHFGDFGQSALRPEQRDAIGEIDVLFVPVGGSATIGAESAAKVVRSVAPRLVVPMHYRTDALGFLEPPDGFLTAFAARLVRSSTSEAVVGDHLGTRDDPTVLMLEPPPSLSD